MATTKTDPKFSDDDIKRYNEFIKIFNTVYPQNSKNTRNRNFTLDLQGGNPMLSAIGDSITATGNVFSAFGRAFGDKDPKGLAGAYALGGNLYSLGSMLFGTDENGKVKVPQGDWKSWDKSKGLVGNISQNAGAIGDVAKGAVGLVKNFSNMSQLGVSKEEIDAVKSANMNTGKMYSDYDALDQAMSSHRDKGHVSWRDLMANGGPLNHYAYGGWTQDVGNTFNAAGQSAKAGSHFGPIGSAVGAGLGVLSSGLGIWARKRKAKREARRINRWNDYGNARDARGFGDSATQIAEEGINEALANYAALGGPLEYSLKSRALDIAQDAVNNESITDDDEESGVSIFAKGGKIHIKEKNKGKFGAAAKKAGMSTQAYARKVLANKDKYSPTLVKRANFARNAAKWKHADGGPLEDYLTQQALSTYVQKPVVPIVRSRYGNINPYMNGDYRPFTQEELDDWIREEGKSSLRELLQSENPEAKLETDADVQRFLRDKYRGFEKNPSLYETAKDYQLRSVSYAGGGSVNKEQSDATYVQKPIVPYHQKFENPIDEDDTEGYLMELYMGEDNDHPTPMDVANQAASMDKIVQSIDPVQVGKKAKEMAKGIKKNILDWQKKQKQKVHETNKLLLSLRDSMTPEDVAALILGGPIIGTINASQRHSQDLVDQAADGKPTVMEPKYPNMHAFGGNLGTNGADFTNGNIEVNAGGSHEENPNGGVQMGVDPNGVPNLVEQGELINNDYVYSDRLVVPGSYRGKYGNRRGKGAKGGTTFAKAAEKASRESVERPNDPISKRGLQTQLSQLAQQQELVRAQQRAQNAINQLAVQQSKAMMQPGARIAAIGGLILNPFNHYGNFNPLAHYGNYNPVANKYNGDEATTNGTQQMQQAAQAIDWNNINWSKLDEWLAKHPNQSPFTYSKDFNNDYWNYSMAQPAEGAEQSTEQKYPKFNTEDKPVTPYGGTNYLWSRIIKYMSDKNILRNEDKEAIKKFSDIVHKQNSNYPEIFDEKTGKVTDIWNDIFTYDGKGNTTDFSYGESISPILAKDLEDSYGQYIGVSESAALKPQPTPEMLAAAGNNGSPTLPQEVAGDNGGTDSDGDPSSDKGTKDEEKKGLDLPFTLDDELWRLGFPSRFMGTMVGSDMLGITNRPNYKFANQLLGASNQTGFERVNYKPVAGYMPYRRLDPTRFITPMQQDYAGMNRYLAQNAGMNANAANADMMAAQQQHNNAIGETRQQVADQDWEQLLGTKQFNFGINQLNAQNALDAAKSNQQGRLAAANSRLENLREGYKMATDAFNISEAGRGQNISQFLEEKGNYGKAKFNFVQAILDAQARADAGIISKADLKQYLKYLGIEG